MSKVALIVDDSRVARHVLTKLLAEYGIVCKSAESAEDALEYLKHRRPDVVFMDHLMPGMDGFEALEAIKANPATATIPVLMYTSQQGELYVGQARALGAFGVLPKELKPTEVQAVLSALHLTPDSETQPARPKETEPARDPDQSRRIEELLQELFYHQRAALREERRQGYQDTMDSVRVPILQESVPAQRSSRASVPVVGFVVALVLATVFGLLYVNVNRSLEQEREQSADLNARIAQLSTLSDLINGSAQSAAGAGAESNPLLRALEQAVAFEPRYGFAELALNDDRAEAIESLVSDLEEAGLSATIAIDVHLGRFCMNVDEQTNWVPAPGDQPSIDCLQQGWSDVEAIARGDRQSVGFANMLRSIARRQRTEIQINSLGHQLPALPYPPLGEYVSAGDWNAVARRNQRVELRFLP
jgi:CheY-like chemotaxis protein